MNDGWMIGNRGMDMTIEPGMLKSATIENYRGFNKLEIENLSRINLVSGKNNTGKTSLLEALFLLSSGGNPQVAMNSNVIRVPANGPYRRIDTLCETYWKPLFNSLDARKAVKISAYRKSEGLLSLEIQLENSAIIERPIEDSTEIFGTNLQNVPALLFTFADSNENRIQCRARINGANVQFEQPEIHTPFNSTILLTGLGNHQEDAQRLGALRKQKRGEVVVNALKMIEPNLLGVEDNSSSGVPMILGDVGMDELIPLVMMGEGMIRLARLVVAIGSTPDGVVLVDEVETGLHHSVLKDVWRGINEASKSFNTQIVATTHSYECIQAAQYALSDSDSLLFHRLDMIDDDCHSVTYGADEIEAAIEHDLEVR